MKKKITNLNITIINFDHDQHSKCILKVHGPIFLFHLKNHYSKAINSKLELKWSSCLDVFCDLQLPLLCKYNCGYHNQVCFSIFQMEHVSVIEFNAGYEKNMSFPICHFKISRSLKSKLKKIN